MKRYANVIIDISLSSLDRPFCYHIPDELAGKIDVGNRVDVPFGRGNNPRKAYVISLLEEPDCDPSIVKDIIGVSGASVSIEEKQFERAQNTVTVSQLLRHANRRNVVLPCKSIVFHIRRTTWREDDAPERARTGVIKIAVDAIEGMATKALQGGRKHHLFDLAVHEGAHANVLQALIEGNVGY